MNENIKIKAIITAILAAALYGICAPVSKLLLAELDATLLASLLYLGAGFGMFAVNIIKKLRKTKQSEAKITKREMPYISAMVILDIAAPVFLMIGLSITTSSNASLLNNFEIVATSLIALFIFKESIGIRMWISIVLITISSIVLTVNNFGELSFSAGSIFVLLACISWGFENNCTRMLSLKDPLQIVVIKGFGSGVGALVISFAVNENSGTFAYIIYALLLGFIAFGLSIYFYISAQRQLGAARTSAYYAAAPFIGVLVSWIFLKEAITPSFLIALLIMLAGTYFAVTEHHKHTHYHEKLTHEHKHSHNDGHHNHVHNQLFEAEHSHVHTHEALTHKHAHMPDLHHRHRH